ncbi:15921_t:CDS:1 [Acaulospora colombiana]|uniref:15921_t:CDS:1 n=1 Tax=Acaulospora colombiana TaxID=27376 RepID=A0ACA9LX81_9GLOM|nr:15921_t:CDS:1 [Acaulospora colombiana]
MFMSVDKLEKVMHKLDTQIAELDDNDLLTTAVSLMDADYLDEIYEVEDASNCSVNSTNFDPRRNMTTYCFGDDIYYEDGDSVRDVMEDELDVIYQKVVFFIKEMEDNMERLERIMRKFMISTPQQPNQT